MVGSMREPVDIVVRVGHAVVQPMAIEDLHDVDITTIFDTEVRLALNALQRGRAAGATRFVMLVAAMAATGEAGLAAPCAASEAVRVLALGAARQWGGEGVTVNCVSLPFPFEPYHLAELASLVTFLGSDAGAHVNGVTIPVGGPVVGL